MKTIQMSLDEELISEVDRVVESLHTTRSAFARMAFKEKLEHLKLEEKERQHRQGYSRKPVAADEFGDWEGEQVWDF